MKWNVPGIQALPKKIIPGSSKSAQNHILNYREPLIAQQYQGYPTFYRPRYLTSRRRGGGDGRGGGGGRRSV